MRVTEIVQRTKSFKRSMLHCSIRRSTEAGVSPWHASVEGEIDT